VSVDTLPDCALRYRKGGFEALAPQPRQDRGQSSAITPQFADLIERLKREHSLLGATPPARRQGDIEHLRRLAPATDLHRLFFHRLNRVVRRDCTFLQRMPRDRANGMRRRPSSCRSRRSVFGAVFCPALVS
jgi:hypothetical protein